MARPNILVLMADQHRYDCVGYSHDYPVRTPHIDRLAHEGAWFERAYTPIPVCCPARQAMLACRRPERFGALWNSGLLGVRSLEPTAFTWTQALRNAGYSLGFVGKWSINPSHDATAFGYNDHVGDAGYASLRRTSYPGMAPPAGWFGGTDPVPLQGSRTHWCADRAIDLIEKYAGQAQPWHVSLNFAEPHLPCCPSEPFASMYAPEDAVEWRSFRDSLQGKPFIQLQQLYNWRIEDFGWEDWAPVVARYYAVISQLDDAVGKVLAAIERLGLQEDTIVVYTADHGDMCGGHRMMDKHYILYQDVVRVPLVIRWPGLTTPGMRIPQFAYNCLDLGPTFLEAAGLPEGPPPVDGRSLTSLLRGQPPLDWRTDVVSTYNGQQFGLYSQRMLLDERWKYIWNCTDVDELYDLQRDADELTNLATRPECAPILSDMRARLYERLRAIDDSLVSSEWMRDQLLLGRKAPS